MGSYVSILNDTHDVWFVRLPHAGADPATANTGHHSITKESVAELAASVAVVGETLGEIQKLIEDVLLKHGFVRLEPGQAFQSPKLTLSLLQSCECFRLVNDDNIFLHLESLMMTKLFTGASNNSINQYTISSYLNNHGGATIECTIAV